MLLPFLLCLLILYLPPPLGGTPAPWPLLAGGVAALAALNALAAWAASGLAIRMQRAMGARGSRLAGRVFTMLNGMVVGLVLADVLALKWPVLVGRIVGERWWSVYAYDPLLLLPAVVMVLTVAAFQHRYDRRRGRVALPLDRYLWLRFRTELAILLVPWLALVAVTGTLTLLFRGSPHAQAADTVGSLAVLGGIVVLGPAMLRAIWRTSRLPDGPLRERLEAFCAAHEFRCHDILIWHTERHMANAGVVGPTPLLRYVMLTDALLERCTGEEVEAIFAHEVGHVRHRHLPFYLLLGAAFVAFYAALIELLAMAGLVEPLDGILAFEITARQATVMLVCAAAYWGLGFGWISRRLEQQADLFALHSAERPEAFIRALGQLAALSRAPVNADTWRHFSVARRVRFLREAWGDRAVERRFQRRLAVALAALIGLAVLATGWLALARPHLFGI